MNPDRPKEESMITGLVLDLREGAFSRLEFRLGAPKRDRGADWKGR
jgi:hypothetical protein